MMFLLADLLLPQTLEGWTELDDEISPQHVVSTHSPTADTYISLANPSSTYNTSASGILSTGVMADSRLLLRFPMNYTSGDTIHSATLNLQCTTDVIGSSDMTVFAGEMKRSWNGSFASWAVFGSNAAWGDLGADSTSDRGVWEPPVHVTGNGTVALNVTSIAQSAARNNLGNLSVIVSSLGALYECHLSETTSASNRPQLVLNTTSGAPNANPTVETDLPVPDGAPWMESDFLLTPVSTPSLSYDNNTGSDVEIQLSNSDDWRSATDQEWFFSTLSTTFGSTGTSGYYTLPSSLSLTNGSTMHMRVRSIDSTGQIGAWDVTSFLLPSLDVYDNADGTASMTFAPSSVGLSEDFIQDSTVSQTAKSIAYGDLTTLESSMTSNKERLIHMRASLDQLGLHDNLTIVTAKMELTRSSYSGDPVVSLHGMEDSGLWNEEEITWNQMSDDGITWYDGGRGNGTATVALADGNQTSSSFSFDVTQAVQNYLDNGDELPLDMMLAVRGKYQSYTSGESILFHSTEAANSADMPSFSLTYKWGNGTPPAPVQLTAPVDGLAIWNKSGHNLSANTQPSLNWTQPSSGDDIIFELATDQDFRLRTWRVDTRTDSDFSATDGTLNMTGANTLDLGNMYFWRMSTVDSDDHYGEWVSSSFLISNLESIYLGNDRYEFRLKHGNGTNDNQYPECMDTYIDSGAVNDNYNGDEELIVDYNTLPSETTILLGCNLVSNLLPDGYAVESAHLSMMLSSSPFNSPNVGLWESNQNNWSDDDATWSSLDGSNSWATAGAKGAERGSLLASASIGTTYSEGDRVDWNVTLAVQNAMREDRRVDFVAGMLGVGSGSSRTAYFYAAEADMSDRPELSFVYVPGSDAVPSNPSLVLPLNGSWSIGTGVDMTPITRPTLNWSFSGNMNIGGYLVQLDTQSDFNSLNSLTVTSWNNVGFDTTNLTYTPASDLDNGSTWYWRVRAVSATNQIGNWSNVYHFQIPDLTTTVYNSTKASVELHHHGALPHLNLPNFVDTYVIENGSGSDSTHENATNLLVGETSSGFQSAALIRIPLSEVPQPANSRVSGAELSLFAEYNSVEGEPVAIRPVLQNWTTSANATTYDGVNNWSLRGGRDIGVDIGSYVDIMDSVSDDWMDFDVTEAVQGALANGQTHLSLMVYSSFTPTADLVRFTSAQGSASERPYLTLTWENGLVATPVTAGQNVAPAANSIVWDETSHALTPEFQPTLSWNYTGQSTVTDWRVFILADADDDMSGLETYDSRIETSSFDLTNLTFTPPNDLDFTQEIRWMVQPLNNGMLGPRSSSTNFFIPEELGSEINSTDATLSIQEGAYVSDLAYPAVMQDTYLDSGNTLSNKGSDTILSVGRSQLSYSNTALRTSSLIDIDFSNLPMPGTYEVLDATLEMDVLSSNGFVFMTVSEMTSSWSESSVWAYPAGNTTTWAGPGAYHSADSEAPFNSGFWVNTTGSFAANVTALVQHALAGGQSGINVILQPEEVNSIVNGRLTLASSEHPSVDLRPRLNITYRITNPFLVVAPTGLQPVDGATLWDTTQPRPSGQNETDFSWNSTITNQSQMVACFASNARFTEDLECYSTAELLNGSVDNASYDAQNNTVINSAMEKGDEWVFWRMRSDQNERIGEWSATQQYRNPDDFGTGDGDGNHSITLQRGTIFTDTSVVPAVPDLTIDSQATVNNGGSANLILGTPAAGAGESRILIEYDLSSLPWPAAMTPTSMVMRLYQNTFSGSVSTTVSAHACSPFSESSTVWANAPSCSSSEITRTTIPALSPSGWVDWDLTSLAQSNIANGNTTMTVMLKRVGTSSATLVFDSSDASTSSQRPTLVLEYIDNVDGIIPPSQPVQIGPLDGTVLYSESGGLLSPLQSPILSWSPLAGATGYILTVANASGVYKYKSWEDSEITNTTFRFNDNLSAGSVFTWWVQGVNQSIPGPSSSRWSFAIGSPNHVDNNDLTFTYTFQTGNEVEAYGHTNIQDTSLYSESGDDNFGGDSALAVGTFCGVLWTAECRATLSLDTGQIPFPVYQQVHSASLGMYVDGWTSAGGATSVSFSIHEVLNPNWTHTSATWNGSTSGISWGAPGMQSGLDYATSPISTTVLNVDSTGWAWFDIGVEGMSVNSQHTWIMIGTANTGHAHASFSSSESLTSENRPKMLLNTTNVTSIDIAPTGSVSTDADTAVNFNSVAYDHLSMVQSPPVLWTSTSGSIGLNGLFTPSTAGTHQVQACFGLVCGVQNISVTPGAPVTLVVSPLTATISADETLAITAEMVDQHGNAVPGEPIIYTPTNGTMNAVTPNVFQPFSTGTHIVQVRHAITGGAFVDVSITVTSGAPSYFELNGCTGTVPAGVWCDITAEVFDQFGNQLDLAEAGNLTWTTTNGNYSELNQQYFPDHVGTWWLNLTSVSGAADEMMITVGHGEIQFLELNTSSTSVTADDRVYINTTRVDVRGNRLSVILPSDNWTKKADGQLTPGSPAIWDPVSRGAKTIEARYESTLSEVVITVVEGKIQTLIIVVDDVESTWETFDLTADETIEAKIRAIDAKGNKWDVQANWSLDHPTMGESSSFLEKALGDSTVFTPYFASDDAYIMTATYFDGTVSHAVSINITVGHGFLHTVSMTATATNPQQTSGADFDMTADYGVDFMAELYDLDNNRIDSSELTWLVDLPDGKTIDATTDLLLSDMSWIPENVGTYTVTAFSISGTGYNISDSVSFTVYHGVPTTVMASVTNSNPTAGDFIQFYVNGTDQYGNVFSQNVQWTENEGEVSGLIADDETDGAYTYGAEVAGIHTLVYRVNTNVESILEINVSAQSLVNRLEVNLTKTTLDQLATLEVNIRAFDAFDNEIAVPPSIKVDASGRATVTMISSEVWTITTLDDGPQTISVNVGSVRVDSNIEVTGTTAGFFEAGGTLYYVGAGLLGLVAIVLLVLLVMFMRSGNEGWDEDDYDDDDEDESPKSRPSGLASGPTGPAPGPSGPAPGPSGPAPGPSGPAPGPSGPAPGPSGPAPSAAEPEVEEATEAESSVEDDDSYRVDEDGTEWWEDEEGTWWFRLSGQEEWEEWTE